MVRTCSIGNNLYCSVTNKHIWETYLIYWIYMDLKGFYEVVQIFWPGRVFPRLRCVKTVRRTWWSWTPLFLAPETLVWSAYHVFWRMFLLKSLLCFFVGGGVEDNFPEEDWSLCYVFRQQNSQKRIFFAVFVPVQKVYKNAPKFNLPFLGEEEYFFAWSGRYVGLPKGLNHRAAQEVSLFVFYVEEVVVAKWADICDFETSKLRVTFSSSRLYFSPGYYLVGMRGTHRGQVN